MCQILSCDVTKPNIITDDKFDQNQKFDVITSLFCFEYAVEDMEQYQEIIKKVVALLKPNGYLILSGVLFTSCWKTGDITFPCLYLTEDCLLNKPCSNLFALILIYNQHSSFPNNVERY